MIRRVHGLYKRDWVDCVAIGWGNEVELSAHWGKLESFEANLLFEIEVVRYKTHLKEPIYLV